MYAASSVIIVSLVITCARSYPGYWSSPSLNPVHGLYVKPSSDGTRGDLYVAATEDNGVKSTWAVDQPVNFLPVAAATQSHGAAVPLSYPGFAKPVEESSTQKRAVITSPTLSPPVQYAYALPVPSSEGSSLATYPYVYPYPVNSSENSATKCDSSSTALHYPFQFFYPQMMASAYSNAMSILKDAGLSEDTASSVMAHHLSPSASPTWPTSSYGYPMYVMVDPSAWLQTQTTTTPSTSTASPNKQEEENSQS